MINVKKKKDLKNIFLKNLHLLRVSYFLSIKISLTTCFKVNNLSGFKEKNRTKSSMQENFSMI